MIGFCKSDTIVLLPVKVQSQFVIELLSKTVVSVNSIIALSVQSSNIKVNPGSNVSSGTITSTDLVSSHTPSETVTV